MTAEVSLEMLLVDPDPEVRRLGAQRLGERSGAAAIALLSRALGDEDWRVRKEAAAVAAVVEPRAEVVAALALLLAERENVGQRNSVVEALVHLGSDAVAAAVHALGALDADGRKLAVEVLGGVPDLEGTHALVRALGDDDPNVRSAAAEALGGAGGAGGEAQRVAVAALTRTLEVDDPLLRLAALGALTRLSATLPWRTFEGLTADRLLRRHAIAAAGRTHDPAAVAALARATADPSIAVARDALVALVGCIAGDSTGDELARVARHELRALPVAVERIRSLAGSLDESRVRGAALVALGLLRVRSDVPELVRGLEDGDVADRAELGLRWFGREAVSVLLEEGSRSSPMVRAATLALVPLLAESPDPDTLDVLREALDAEAPQVRTAALRALAATGSSDDLAVLASHTTSQDPRIAASAATALSSLASRHVSEARTMTETIPPDSPVAIVGCLLRGATTVGGGRSGGPASASSDLRFLRGALDHGDLRVRRAAVEALAAMGGPAAAEVAARALADEERDVVLSAIRALGRMGHWEPLVAMLEGAHDAVVVAAALRAMGEASPTRALDAALVLLGSDEPLLASSAIETVGQLGGAQRDEGLARALKHRDPGVVKTALVELSRELGPATMKRIGVCLEHPSPEVRRFAAELLAGGDPAAHAMLRAKLEHEPDLAVRDAIALALAARDEGEPEEV